MKTYLKRVAFLVSDQHFIAHGGIGQFTKAFTEMCLRINWKVDIILDKAPDEEFKGYMEEAGARIIYPSEPLRYTDHTATFAFTDSINFEKIANFRKSLLKAFQTNLYDLIVCNSQESMTAAYGLAINEYVPVVFYTHLHSMIFREAKNYKDVFLGNYHHYYNKHLEFPGVIIGTQSEHNLKELAKYKDINSKLLRMPMTERGLLNLKGTNKSGVLFIGRWEDGKNPEAFVKVIDETNLPAKVLTNSAGAKKFEKAFIEKGITNYTIKHGLVLAEKVDFIINSKMLFNPSFRESYSFATFECIGHMPVMVLNNQDWDNNFDRKYINRTGLDGASDLAKAIYDEYDDYYASTDALEYVRDLDNQATIDWIKLVDDFVSKRSNTNTARINQHETVNYREFIEGLDRSHLAREDFESVLSNRYKFDNIIYTDNDTYLSKDKNFAPKKESTDLFEGLV